MEKKKKKQEVVPAAEYQEIVDNYQKELVTNPQYSLEADPTGKYNMSDLEKKFVETYSEVKSVPLAAEMLGMEQDLAMQLFSMYHIRREINRINMAQLHRRTLVKMWDYDKLGSYLTTMLTDDNVPLADRLNSKDKLNVVRLLIDINDRKQDLVDNPIEVDAIDLDEQLKELSVESIKALLEQGGINDKKAEIVSQLKKTADFSLEEEQMLRSMSLTELEALLKDSKK